MNDESENTKLNTAVDTSTEEAVVEQANVEHVAIEEQSAAHVETEQEQEVSEKPLTVAEKRSARMDEISRKVPGNADAERALSNPETEQPDKENPETEEEAPELANGEKIQDSAPIHKGKDGIYYATVKVNGVNREVEYSEVSKNYQKNMHADAGLREVAAGRAQLDHDIAAFNAQKESQAPPNSGEPKTALPQEGEQKQSIASVITKLRAAILYDDEGAEAEATESLDQLLNSNKQVANKPEVDPTQIANQVRTDIIRESAIDNVRSNPTYEKLFTDSFALQEMNDHSSQIRHEHPNLSIEDNLKMAGDRVIERARQMAGTTNVTDFSARIQAKKTLTNTSGFSGTQRAKIAQETPMVESTKDIIAGMRKQRTGR